MAADGFIEQEPVTSLGGWLLPRGLSKRVLCLQMLNERVSWLLFCQPDASQGHLTRENNSRENASIRLARGQAYRAFFKLVRNMGGPIRLRVVPPLGQVILGI